MYEMYEDDTIDVEGILEGDTEDYEDPAMDNVLYREVTTPESNDNYVNALVMLPRRKNLCQREGHQEEKRCRWECCWEKK